MAHFFKKKRMDTEKRVAHPKPFVYWFGLQNLRRHMCCRTSKTKLGGGSLESVISVQSVTNEHVIIYLFFNLERNILLQATFYFVFYDM